MDKYFDFVETVTVDLHTKEVIRGSSRSFLHVQEERPKHVQEERPKHVQEGRPKHVQEERPKHVQEERPKHVQEERPKHVQEGLGEVAAENTNRLEQIEAMIEILLELKKSKKLPLNSNENSSNELVLNSEMVSPGCNFEKLGKVLGKGNSSKEVILVRDKVTGQELAYKTIMLAQFNPDEIRAWVSLADESMSPELYCFKLNGSKVEYFMEPLQGATLQEIIENGILLQDFEIAEQFALCVLDDLLKELQKLTDDNFAHGDFHGGNVMLTHLMQVKLIDFGSARRLFSPADGDKSGMLENDIVGIIRMFCCLYSGVDFNDIFDAKKQLRGGDLNLSKLRDNMGHIPEVSRLEVFKIMTMLYDTVRDVKQEGFGDTSQVAVYVKNKLPEDKKLFLAKVAVILKLDGFQKQTTSSRSQMNSGIECDSIDGFMGRVSVWDDPELNYLAINVTIKDLQKLDEAVSFF